MTSIYFKDTSERLEKYQIITEIKLLESDKKKIVTKKAASYYANPQIARISGIYPLYKASISKENVMIPKLLSKDEKSLEFEYFDGDNLDNILSNAIINKKLDLFNKAVTSFYNFLYSSFKNVEGFYPTLSFCQFFGEDIDLTKLKSNKSFVIANLDMNFDNIIWDQKTNQFFIYDIEWIFNFQVPINYIFFRALNAFQIRHPLIFNNDMMISTFEKFGISEQELSIYNVLERNFMSVVHKNKKLENYLKQNIDLFPIQQYKMELFIATEQGFDKKRVIVKDVKNNNEEFQEFEFDLFHLLELRTTSTELLKIRIDPLNDSAVVDIEELYLKLANGEKVSCLDKTQSNASIIHSNVFFFTTNDPQIIINFAGFNITERVLSIFIKCKYIHIGREAVYVTSKQLENDKNYISNLNSELKTTVADLDTKIITTENQNSDLKTNITKLEIQVKNLTSQVNDITSQVSHLASVNFQLTTTLNSIHKSRSWRLLTIYAHLSTKTIPYGSFRRKMLAYMYHILRPILQILWQFIKIIKPFSQSEKEEYKRIKKYKLFDKNFYRNTHKTLGFYKYFPLRHFVKYGRTQYRVIYNKDDEEFICARRDNIYISKKTEIFRIKKNIPTSQFQNYLDSEIVEKIEEDRKNRRTEAIDHFSLIPKISIILFYQNSNDTIFDEFIDSLSLQSYEHWELFILGESYEFLFSESLIKLKKKNKQINFVKFKKSDSLVEIIKAKHSELSGSYVLILNSKDLLCSNCFYEIIKSINDDPNQEIIISKHIPNASHIGNYFGIKDFPNLDNFISNHFFGFLGIILIKNILFKKIINSPIETNNPILHITKTLLQEYEGIKISKIDKELMYFREIPGSRYVDLDKIKMPEQEIYFISIPLKVSVDSRLLNRKITGTERYISELLKSFSEYRDYANLEIISVCFTPSSTNFKKILNKSLTNSLYKETDIFHKPFQSTELASLKELLSFKRTIISNLDLIAFKFKDYFYNDNTHNYYCRNTIAALKYVDRIIAISKHCKRDITETLSISSDKVSAIYLGVDFSSFTKEYDTKESKLFRLKYRLPNKYLLFVGTDYPHKNLKSLLLSFDKVKRHLGEIKLVIVGVKCYCRTQASLDNLKNSLAGYIMDLGYFPDEDIHLLYKYAWALVYPSLYEGFGFPPLEAMYFSVPVLASDKTSIPEVVSNSSLVVDCTNIEKFSEALINICLNSELRRELVNRGNERVKIFSWDITAKKTIECYYETWKSSLANLAKDDYGVNLLGYVNYSFVNILIYTHVKFYPSSAGNEIRLLNLIKYLKRLGFSIHVVFRPIDGIFFSEKEIDKIKDLVTLYQVGLNNLHKFEKSLSIEQESTLIRCENLEDMFIPLSCLGEIFSIIDKVKPDIVIAEYIWTSRIFKILPDNVLKIIDTIDKFSNKDKNVCAYGIKDQLSITEVEEDSYFRRSDIIIAIQSNEAKEFLSLNPKCKIITVGVDFPPVIKHHKFNGLKNILVVASSNELNVFSIRNFIKNIWPEIHNRFPYLTLKVVGSIYKTLNYTNDKDLNVEIVGYVEDLSKEYSEALIVINPIVAGTGLKIKSIEALAHGKALVSTPAGVEGIQDINDTIFLIAKDSSEFIEHISMLVQDEEKIKILEKNSIKYMQKELIPERTYKELIDSIDDYLLHGKRRKTLCLFLRYGTEKYPESFDILRSWYKKNNLDENVMFWIIDNKLQDETDLINEDGVRLLSGDNSFWEFSAWQKVIAKYRNEVNSYDIIHFVTDAFYTLYTDYLALPFKGEHIEFIYKNSAALGHIDYFDNPVNAFGHESQSWIRSCFFFMSKYTLSIIGNINFMEDKSDIFDEQGFKETAPIDDLFKKNINNWLDGVTLQGMKWHTKIKDLNHFRSKATSLLNEHMLSIKMRESGIKIIDFTWIDKQFKTIKSVNNDLIPEWRTQIENRF